MNKKNENKEMSAKLWRLKANRFVVHVLLVFEVAVLACWILSSLFAESAIGEAMIVTLDTVVMALVLANGGICVLFLVLLKDHAEIEEELQKRVSELERKVGKNQSFFDE